jgi:hypothetical protein
VAAQSVCVMPYSSECAGVCVSSADDPQDCHDLSLEGSVSNGFPACIIAMCSKPRARAYGCALHAPAIYHGEPGSSSMSQ